jgi:hypothetical protein
MKKIYYSLILAVVSVTSLSSIGQHSVAHQWTEINLEAIRRDIARPTVHARNLFHLSVAMYDAWAAYDDTAEPFFLGKSLGAYNCVYNGITLPTDIEAARKQAVCYAAYRILRNRYQGSPGQANTFMTLDSMMAGRGYPVSFTNTDYVNQGPAALGNYIGQQLIAAGYQDGANQQNSYANQYYQPVNESIFMVLDSVGNPNITDLNRWQPISVPLFYDQACQPFPYTPPFLGPEWGNVVGFALADSVKTLHTRDGNNWPVYHDPGPPPLHSMEGDGETIDYQTGFEMVAIWSSHLDANDGVMWDISPASRGNFDHNNWPQGHDDYLSFYDMFNGGTPNPGHAINPSTGMPYSPQMVPRGDYVRILAEFWADGPSSETPPGHWFSIYNAVSDYPAFTWQWEGTGTALSHLEYDVKAYLTLGGALHDCAVSTWGAKGYYDYLRPVSAIRALSDLGQASDSNLLNYHPGGIHLYPGYIELVNVGDPLAGDNDENVGKIKLKCWLGPIIDDNSDPCIDGANYVPITLGVGWKLAENWWPYQRPSFVSPNFGGYVSGHSTFSRAAAEVMTDITGDEYFPGGMGVFNTPQNDFLVFEEGPSVQMELEWATYRDAADQCSLSRIWGGIHPPQDDIRGRKMGYQIGMDALVHANTLFTGGRPVVQSLIVSDNALNDSDDASSLTMTVQFNKEMNMNYLPQLNFSPLDPTSSSLTLSSASWTNNQTYVYTYTVNDVNENLGLLDVYLSGARGISGGLQMDYGQLGAILIDTENPAIVDMSFAETSAQATVELTFSEDMDTATSVTITFPVEDPLSEVLTLNSASWLSNTVYQVIYDITDDTQVYDLDVTFSAGLDAAGNPMITSENVDLITIDLHDPVLTSITPSVFLLNRADIGLDALAVTLVYDEEMDPAFMPELSFPAEDGAAAGLNENISGLWTDLDTYVAIFDLSDESAELAAIDIAVEAAQDRSGNIQANNAEMNLISIDTRTPLVDSEVLSDALLTDASEGTDMLSLDIIFDEAMDMLTIPSLSFPVEEASAALSVASVTWVDAMTLNISLDVSDIDADLLAVDLQVNGAADMAGNPMDDLLIADALDIKMRNPQVSAVVIDQSSISDAQTGTLFNVDFSFDEDMDMDDIPTVVFMGGSLGGTLDLLDKVWNSATSLTAAYLINDAGVVVENINVQVTSGSDADGNALTINSSDLDLFIDTENPTVSGLVISPDLISNVNVGTEMFSIEVNFSEEMALNVPVLDFPLENPNSSLVFNATASSWINSSTYRFVFDVIEGENSLADVDLRLTMATDTIGNSMTLYDVLNAFDIDIVSGLIEQDGLSLQIYPNPVNHGELNINMLRGSMGSSVLRIFDNIGKLVSSEQVNLNASSTVRISTARLADGIYQVLIEDGQYSVRHKMLVVH